MTHVVYWLHDKTCRDYKTDGYVGVTGQLDNRTRTHRRAFRRKGFDIKVIYRGPEEQCYQREKKLRPHVGIGWNIAPGGKGYRHGWGYKPTSEHIAKLREILDQLPPPMLGKKHSEETKAKMRASHLQAVAEGRAYQGGFRGKHTEETKIKIRAARLKQSDPRKGKKHSEAAKEKMRLARLANPQPRCPITGRLLSR